MTERQTSRRGTSSAVDDAWIRRLLVAVLVTLVLILTAVVYVVYTGVFSGQAPRTLAEKEIASLDLEFKAAPGNPQVVSDYMRALIEVERYSKARSVLNTYRSAETSGSALVSVEEARLYLATEAPDEALEIAERALTEAEAEKAYAIAERERVGVFAPYVSDAVINAALLQAEIHESLGSDSEALSALDRALEESSMMADILTWRGDVNRRLGNTAAARSDYEKALSHIPDYKPALEGLDALKGGGNSD